MTFFSETYEQFLNFFDGKSGLQTCCKTTVYLLHVECMHLNFISWNVLFLKLLSLQPLQQTRFADVSVTLYDNLHCNRHTPPYSRMTQHTVQYITIPNCFKTTVLIGTAK